MTAMSELLRELAGAENIVGPRDERHPLCARPGEETSGARGLDSRRECRAQRRHSR